MTNPDQMRHAGLSGAAGPLGRRSATRPLQRPSVVAAIVVLVGSAVTALTSATAWRLDHNTETRLLQVQTRQAAALVGSAVVSIQSPLQTALDLATGTNGSPQAFLHYIAAHAGAAGPFAAASLWRVGGMHPTELATTRNFSVESSEPVIATMINKAVQSKVLTIIGLPATSLKRIGYSLAAPQAGYAIYAEREIPANRRVPIESNSAFSDLDFATYVGADEQTSHLATTDVAVTTLPLRGHTFTERIPFGNTVITLVTRARGHLGGSLGAQLWWLVLIAGALLTMIAASLAFRLARRRLGAEADATTIADLFHKLDDMYGEQRSISLTLQRALLPQTNPEIAPLEIASRYEAGVAGVEVGGDWYSIIPLADDRFGFVVGDVSGRGINAAATMARLRFTIRAYLVEGHPPEVALELCSNQLDVRRDGHIATALVGIGRLTTREITLASAGHPSPLVLGSAGARFTEIAVGRPLGATPASYTATTVVMEPGSTLLAFTDGLVERRDEGIDVGLDRLRETAARVSGPLEDQLSQIVKAMAGEGADDDLAILAFRWR